MRRTARRIVVASVVVLALLAVCSADVARGAAASHDAEDCGTRLCDERTGCSSPHVTAPALVPVVLAPVTTVTADAGRDEPRPSVAARRDHGPPVRHSRPRSPPPLT